MHVSPLRPVSSSVALAGATFLVPAILAPHAGAQTAAKFEERALSLGLEHRTLSGFDDFGQGEELVRDYAQSGIAFGDVDGDGDQDLVALGSLMPNRLFLNPGPAVALSAPWAEVAEQAGIRSGELDRAPALGDYDLDGDLDLFIGAMEGIGLGPRPGRGRLYDNDGAAFFADVTARAGTRGHGRTLFAHWFDLNLDGLLDLVTSEFHQTPNAYYRNEGQGSFTELGAERGLDNAGSTHVTAIADLDDDGYPDVVVGNDHGIGVVTMTPGNLGDALLKGDADGFFTDVSAGSGTDVESGIMGLAFGDVDSDGAPDIYKTDLGANHLFTNRGWPASGTPFEDETEYYRVVCSTLPFPEAPTGLSRAVGWAVFFLDVDHDGWDDLFVVNGHVAGGNPLQSLLVRGQKNFLYRNRGPAGNFLFADATDLFGLLDGFDDRAAAWADLDRDGDLEIALLETAGGLRLFDSAVATTDVGWLEARLHCGTSAPEGVGARVRFVDPDGSHHSRWVGGDGPTASQPERLVHFGLGTRSQVDLEVRFPSGIEFTLPDVPKNSALDIVEPRLFELAATVFPAAGAEHSGSGQPGVAEVIVHAAAADGTPLGPGAAVAIEVPGLTPAGPVVDLGDGRYSASFGLDAEPGAYRVEVNCAGFVPRVRPVLHLTGAPDAERSQVTLQPDALRAGSGDTARWTVVPRDGNGVAIGPGLKLRMLPDGVLGGGLFVDQQDGSYTLALSAPAEPGVFAAQIEANGVLLQPAAPLEVAGPASAETTLVFGQPIRPHEVASPDVIRASVLARDDQERRLGSGAVVELLPLPIRLVSDRVTPPASLRGTGSGGTGSGSGGAPAGAPGAPSAGAGPGPLSDLGDGSPSWVEYVEPLEVERSGRADGRWIFAFRAPQIVLDTVEELEAELRVDGLSLGIVRVPLRF